MFSKILLKKLRRVLLPHGLTIRVRRKKVGMLGGSTAKYKKQKEAARAFVHKKLELFNRHYGFAYNNVAIRNQRSRWGSCSKKGNLNFNYRILLLPEHLADSVIVHELCHLKEFNHSKAFWKLVEETIPDHKARRLALARLSTLNSV